MTQSIVALIILDYIRPLKSKSIHKNEKFNEIVTLLLLYTFLSFTDWVPNLETKFKLGYVACGLISLHLAINIFTILISSIKGVYKVWRLRLYRSRHNKERVILRKRLQTNRKQRRQRSNILWGR